MEEAREDYIRVRRLLSEVEGTGYELEWQATYEAGLQRIAANEHDVYLLDNVLGDRSGLELLRELARHGHTTAIILVGVDDPGLDQQAMEIGAADFLLKSQIDSALLERSIRYAIERRRIAEELSQATAAAEAATRSRSELLAEMSHEIRTPLSGVSGMVNILLHSTLTAEQTECAETIHTECQNLLAIVNEVLDSAKIEAGAVELEQRTFELRRLVEGLTGSLAPEAAERGVELTCTLAPEVPRFIAGDSTRLSQVLRNLIANGLRFTERGKVTVAVRGQPRGEETVELFFSVRDTGIGIAAERQGEVFTASSSPADTAPMRRGMGTGLGLATCKKIVELMGGKIWVESEVGKGSTFHLAIRASTLSGFADPDDVEAQDLPRLVEGFAERFPLEILIADDDATNRKVMQNLLSLMGYEPDIAVDGIEVLAALRERSYDLLMMDLNMPGVDGFEVARWVVDNYPRSARPEMVAVTATTTGRVRERCREAGMDDYLSKPIVLEALVRILRREGRGTQDATRVATG